MCAGAASVSGATAATAATATEAPEASAGDLASGLVSDSRTVVKALPPQVRTVPGRIRDTVAPPRPDSVQMPEAPGAPEAPEPGDREDKAGDQRLDFGPFGIFSAHNTRPGELVAHTVADAMNKLSAVTE
jgi:hypothetical protein